MTLVALPTEILYPGFGHTNNSTIAFATGSSLTAAGHYSCFIFRAREAMAISHVYLRLAAVTGSPTADVRIETVDASTGLPSGTLWATNTNVVTGTLTTTGTVHALTATANIAVGDYVAVKIAYNSGTSFALQTVPFARVGQSSLPYVVGNTGTPTKAGQLSSGSNIALGSSSTTFYRVQGLLPAQGASVTGSVSTSTYDALGMRFKIPYKARCCGLITTINSSTYGEFKYGIYTGDASGTEVDNSETTGFDNSMMGLQANGPHLRLDFDSPATLLPDTWYRAALWPTSTTAFVLQAYGAPDANIKAIQPGGTNWHYTRKAIGGAWDDSFVNDSLVINLIIEQLDDGVGGGTSFSPLLSV